MSEENIEQEINTEVDQPTSLRDLLETEIEQAGKSEGDESPDGEPAGDGTEKGELKKFNDLAGKSGIELDALYALEIDDKDGNPVTIEQLKDVYGKQGDFAVRELEFEENVKKREQEFLKTQEQLRQVIAALPKNAVSQEALQKADKQWQDHLDKERGLALEAIPVWKNEEKRTEEIREIAGFLGDYGLPENFLEMVSDHRMLVLIRDSWSRKSMIDRALKGVKKEKSKTTTSKPNGKAPTKNAPTTPRVKGPRNKLAEALN